MPSPEAIAVALIKDKAGRYLFVQERKPSAYGLWGPPGGHVDEGETAEIAAIREILEEVSLNIEIIGENPIYESFIPATDVPYSAYAAKIIGGQLKIKEDELLDAKWFLPRQLEELHAAGGMRSSLGMQAVLKVEANENSGN